MTTTTKSEEDTMNGINDCPPRDLAGLRVLMNRPSPFTDADNNTTTTKETEMTDTTSKTSRGLTIKVNLGLNAEGAFDGPALKTILDSIWNDLTFGIDQGTAEAESTFADGYWSFATFKLNS
jgi:hypothetical protein